MADHSTLDENISTLMAMGFGDINDIQRALRAAGNDINEAVSYLTHERALPSNSPSLSLEPIRSNSPRMTAQGDILDSALVCMEDNPEFPEAHLYDLESRMYSSQWTIPHLQEEALGQCLQAAIRIVKEDALNHNELCLRFVNQCLPECFRKLLTTAAVRSWTSDVQEGIRQMCLFMIELTVVMLRVNSHHVLPLLRHTLLLVFDSECEWHQKNKMKSSEESKRINRRGSTQFAKCTEDTFEPFGWLVDLVNAYGDHGAFSLIYDKFAGKNRPSDLVTMASMLLPLRYCVNVLHPPTLTPILLPCLEKVIELIKDMQEDTLKKGPLQAVTDLVTATTALYGVLCPDELPVIFEERLRLILMALKTPSFNVRMYALKEISRLIEEAESSSPRSTTIKGDKVLEWMTTNQLLSIALEGNMDHSQYSERVRGLVEFLGPHLTLQELSRIWALQDKGAQDPLLTDNVYGILMAAASRLTAPQMNHLLQLLRERWERTSYAGKEKLLHLLGGLGREMARTRPPSPSPSPIDRPPPARDPHKAMELLWNLARTPDIPPSMVAMAHDEMLTVMADCHNRDKMCYVYMKKCVDDVREEEGVYPAMCHLHNLASLLIRGAGSRKVQKALLVDLNDENDLVQLTVESLCNCHKMAVDVSMRTSQLLSLDSLVDGKCSLGSILHVHLNFLYFLLREVDLYLTWDHCCTLWEVLVSSPSACDGDREFLLPWLCQCLSDLEMGVGDKVFTEKILELPPQLITPKGFECFKDFFQSINSSKGGLRRDGGHFIVDRLDLLGLEFVWSLLLDSPSEEVALSCVDLILDVVQRKLSSRLKKNSRTLHLNFITEYCSRLQMCLDDIDALTNKTNNSFTPSEFCVIQHAYRLLLLAEQFVSTVERDFGGVRTLPPHGTTFRGRPITLHINAPHSNFKLKCHSTESVSGLKSRISIQLDVSLDQLQFYFQPPEGRDILLTCNRDTEVLSLLAQHTQEVTWNIKITQGVASSAKLTELDENWDEPATGSQESSASNNQSDEEKYLPGVVMAGNLSLFPLLFRLAQINDNRVTHGVRRLLHLLPSDSAVWESLEGLLLPPTLTPSPPSTTRTHKLSSLDCASKQQTLCGIISAAAKTPFRLLYFLEVLSGKLLPLDTNRVSPFWHPFIEVRGLAILLDLLTGENGLLPADVAQDVKNECLLITLQLVRYMLIGPPDTPGQSPMPLSPQKFQANSQGSSTSSHGPVWTNPVTEEDIPRVLNCLVKLCWCASMGRWHPSPALSVPPRESPLGGGGMGRQSSTGSSGSSTSETDGMTGAGSATLLLSDADSLIAREAIELLSLWLQQAPKHAAISFCRLPALRDFVVDCVLVSPCQQVREMASKQLLDLCLSTAQQKPAPKILMLEVLLKAPVPLWVPSLQVRSTTQRLIGQCGAYFNLLSGLLTGLTEEEQRLCGSNIQLSLEEELSWLTHFQPPTPSSTFPSARRQADEYIRGHLCVTRAFFSCAGIDKRVFGDTLIPELMNNFLFPLNGPDEHGGVGSDVGVTQAKCQSAYCREAAYQLLVEMVKGDEGNMTVLANHLIKNHHQFSPELARIFEHEPQLQGRSVCGYVGLKNAAATCYMNAILQHLFMVPGVPEALLAVPDDFLDEDSVFFQLQMVFGHLLHSQLQFFTPEHFWKCFRLRGQPVNIREQQDAFEFFTQLVDQIDENLMKMGRPKVFQPHFEGIFLDQKICKDCPHRYTREETFSALNLTVMDNNLQDSLAHFVKDEILEGDNAYFCEKCNRKRTAVKRLTLRSLPPTLVIQLKRFQYDWEAGRSLKFDDYFQFPLDLDVGRYMSVSDGWGRDGSDSPLPSSPRTNTTCCLYELVGVVVHSGQASAGHYYSYIKERRTGGEYLSNKSRWFKFNDITVEEWDESTLEAECFGGTYKAKVNTDISCSLPEERLRYWNAYLLFYQRKESPRTPRTPMKNSAARSKSFRGTPQSPPVSLLSHRRGDSLSHLSYLLSQGEEQGLFEEPLPSRVAQAVRDANLTYVQNRGLYCQEYASFVYQLCRASLEGGNEESVRWGVDLGVRFLLNTWCHTRMMMLDDLFRWQQLLRDLLGKSTVGMEWFLNYMHSDEGVQHLKSYLLECPTIQIRQQVVLIIRFAVELYFKNGGETYIGCALDTLFGSLLHLMDVDVASNWRTSGQFFHLIHTYANMGSSHCVHLLRLGAFRMLISFIMGPSFWDRKGINKSETIVMTSPPTTRRWSTAQLREMAEAFQILASLVLACNIYKNIDDDEQDEMSSCSQRVIGEVNIAVNGPCTPWFLKEMVSTYRELGFTVVPKLLEMLQTCAFQDTIFSKALIAEALNQYKSTQVTELVHLANLISELLIMQDSLQTERLTMILDGCNSQPGLISLLNTSHESDSRRAYQSLKLLVGVAGRSSVLREQLLNQVSKWEWAVRWLQGRMVPTERAIWASDGDFRFQRTSSAQVTLDEATALLTEKMDTTDPTLIDMEETDSNFVMDLVDS